jgi:uncharacterized protein (TIRG00374 family)
LVAVVGVGGVALLALVAGSTLTDSIRAFGHLDWVWVPLAVAAEAASMAAFARTQRRLLRSGGADIHLGSMMAVTYAGNAISVSLPLAGSEVATGFSFRQFSRRGVDRAVVAWALAVSGIISSFAFALVLAAGALSSGSTAAVIAGLGGAFVSLVPVLAVVAALRFAVVWRFLNRLLDRLVRVSRRFFNWPGPGAERALDRFLDRIASLHLPRLQYAEVFALAVWNWVADCLCLAFAIRATGSPIPWQGLFLAYGAGMTAGSIGLTPGGLGIIEVALSAALVAAGLKGHHALASVLVYRLISFWLVMAAGWVVLAVLTRATPEAERLSATG